MTKTIKKNSKVNIEVPKECINIEVPKVIMDSPERKLEKENILFMKSNRLTDVLKKTSELVGRDGSGITNMELVVNGVYEGIPAYNTKFEKYETNMNVVIFITLNFRVYMFKYFFGQQTEMYLIKEHISKVTFREDFKKIKKESHFDELDPLDFSIKKS